MKKITLTVWLFFGFCLINANVHSQGERERGKPSPNKRGKITQTTEAALTKACKADINRFCNGIEPGPQQGQCLMKNEKMLGANCGKMLKSLPPPDQEGGPGGDSSGNQEAGAALMKACKDDISRFCKGIEPGPQQGQCLMGNESKLSADCGKTLKSLPPPDQDGAPGEGGSSKQKAGAALMKACKNDISKFCKGINPGPQQGQCLMKNENKLSADCGKTLKSLPPPDQDGASGEGGSSRQKTVAALMKACKNDISRFCKDIAPGPQQGRCLKENENKLSAGCGKTLKSLPPPEQGNGPGRAGPGGQEGE
ncbi:MAG: cysteine rich repeat-containing protein [Elusimicrobia bacterium]|nr:cysteine rich repeat-containing protein [Elusimicrobiota bacterium]